MFALSLSFAQGSYGSSEILLSKYFTSQPTFAFSGFSATNYLSFIGSNGPNVNVGETIIIAYRCPSATATASLVGYLGTNSGWKIYSNGGSFSFSCYTGSTISHTIQNGTYGYRVCAITRLPDGTIHSSTNGEAVRVSAGATGYVAPDSSGSFWIGRENASNFASNHTVLWFCHIPATLSDTDLKQFSRNDLDERYAIQSAIYSASDLVIKPSDWNGSNSSFAPSKGAIIITVNGSLSKQLIPGEDLYSLDSSVASPFWSTLESSEDTTPSGYSFTKRSQWAEFRLQTNSSFIGINSLYASNGPGLNYFAVRKEGTTPSSMLLWTAQDCLTASETALAGTLENYVISDGSSPLPTAHQRNSAQSFRVTAGSFVKALPRSIGSHGLVHYGDSISTGTGADISIAESGIQQASRWLRDRYGIEFLTESYPGRELWHDTNTPEIMSDFVAKIAAFLNTKTTKTFTTLIGRNDCTYFPYTPTQFRATLVTLFQALTTACPGIRIKAIAPIISGDEATSYNGHTMSEFRTATQGAVSDLVALGYSNVDFIDGYPWVSSSNLYGPWHPNTIGYGELAAGYLYDVMLLPRCAITSPASGATLTRTVATTFSGTLDRGTSVTAAKMIVDGADVGAIGDFTISASTWSYAYTPQSTGNKSISVQFTYANGAVAHSAIGTYTTQDIDYSLPTSYSGLIAWYSLKNSTVASSVLAQTPDNYTTKTNCTVTAGAADPDGGTGAFTITDSGTGYHTNVQNNTGWTGETIQSGDVIFSAIVSRPGGSTLNFQLGNTNGYAVNTNIGTSAQTQIGNTNVFRSASAYNGGSWVKIDTVQAGTTQCSMATLNASLAGSYTATGQSIYVYPPPGNYIARQDQITAITDLSGNGYNISPASGATRYFRIPDLSSGGYWWGAASSGTNKSAPLPNAIQDVLAGTFTVCARIYVNSVGVGTQDWVYLTGSGSRQVKIRRNGSAIEFYRYNDAAESQTVTIVDAITVGTHTLSISFNHLTGAVLCSYDKGTDVSGTSVAGTMTAGHLSNSSYLYANGNCYSEFALYSGVLSKANRDTIVDGFTSRKGVVP